MGAMIILMVLLAIYFVPAIVAANRHHRQTAGIFLLNLLLGWTLLGWVVALVWSVQSGAEQPAVAPTTVARDNRKCPHCAELIKAEAKVCRYCGRDVEPILVRSPPVAD